MVQMPSVLSGPFRPLAQRDHQPLRLTPPGAFQPAATRRKLWDLSKSIHCSIIGTCLGSSELRRIVAKATGEPQDRYSDHEIHKRGVALASGHRPAARILHKALEARHASIVRQFDKAATADDIRRLWNEARAKGDIPGAYWAALTHPLTSETLAGEIFGDIHMLSHLVGSANRADIRRLAEIEAENARLTDTIHRQQTLLHEGAVEHRREIERLERLLADRLSRAYQNISKDTFNASADVEQVLARMQTKLDREIAHRRKCERDRDLLREERDAAAADLRAAMARAAESRAEVVTLEAYMDATEPNGGGAQDAALDGLGLLYVGGRSGRANQLRLAAGKRGALLEIHDGGQQEASSLLSGLIARADVVFFPVDFVSHEAALSIKRQCKQAGKPYVPLPSAGLGCFITALERRWLDGTGRLGVDI